MIPRVIIAPTLTKKQQSNALVIYQNIHQGLIKDYAATKDPLYLKLIDTYEKHIIDMSNYVPTMVKQCGVLWIIVNPKPNVTIQELSSVVAKVLSKIWVKTCTYSYEFNKPEAENSGLCLYMAIPRGNKNRYASILETRTALSCFGDTEDIVLIKDHSYDNYDKYIGYMKWELNDDRMDDEKEYTLAKRRELDLLDLYTYNRVN